MNNTTEIDVRGMAPPGPFEIIMPALQTLAPDAVLQVFIHRGPFPLYDVMRESGFVWQTDKLDENNFRIRITRAS